MKYKTYLTMLFFSFAGMNFVNAQSKPWKKGIVEEEFIFNKAPFPSCHAATIAETPKGLVAAWFGGTKERNPDVEIYVSRKINHTWTK
ncbi:MAG TPA: sialidase, partial [Hanamia sp.]|nr:sialidase [Hanamia sp.]